MKNEKNFFKEMISILLLSPFIIYFVLYVLKFLIIKFHLEEFVIGSVDSWINYVGVIIGSMITIFTVVDAIGRSNQLRSEEELRNIQPFVIIKPRTALEDSLQKIFYDINGPSNYPIYFDIDLLTINSAKDLKMVSSKITRVEDINDTHKNVFDMENDIEHTQCFFIELDQNNKFISPKTKEFYQMNCFITEKSKDTAFFVEVVLEYSDIFDLAMYTHFYKFVFNLNISRNGDVHFFLDSSTNRIHNVEKNIYH